MESIIDLIAWFKANGAQFAVIVTSVIGTASVIVKITPTPKDDEVLGKIKKFISKFVALNPEE